MSTTRNVVNRPLTVACSACGAHAFHKCLDRRTNEPMTTTHAQRLVDVRRARLHGKKR